MTSQTLRKKYIVGAAIGALLVAGIAIVYIRDTRSSVVVVHPAQQGTAPAPSHVSVLIGGVTIDAKVAATDAARTQGLSGTTSLPTHTGMLFVFDAPGYDSFWMKDMNYPIDIIWLDKDKKITYVVPNAAPASYPTTFTPKFPSLYVLEVPAGFAATYALKAGDRASFQY